MNNTFKTFEEFTSVAYPDRGSAGAGKPLYLFNDGNKGDNKKAPSTIQALGQKLYQATKQPITIKHNEAANTFEVSGTTYSENTMNSKEAKLVIQGAGLKKLKASTGRYPGGNFKQYTFVGEGIDSTNIIDMDDKYPEITTGIKDNYYGVTDHVDTLAEFLRDATSEDDEWRAERDLWQKIAKMVDKSKLGKFL